MHVIFGIIVSQIIVILFALAHVIARHLDPQGQVFSDRILSRDECFSQNSKTANLKELFPRGDHMVSFY